MSSLVVVIVVVDVVWFGTVYGRLDRGRKTSKINDVSLRCLFDMSLRPTDEIRSHFGSSTGTHSLSSLSDTRRLHRSMPHDEAR